MSSSKPVMRNFSPSSFGEPSSDFVVGVRFPTLQELVEAAGEETEVRLEEQRTRRLPSGLFHELLGGDARVLMLDAERHPEKYTQEMLDAILGAVSGNPSPEQAALLNLAAVEYATAPRRIKSKEQVKSAGVPTEEGRPTPGVDIPSGAHPFWWRR